MVDSINDPNSHQVVRFNNPILVHPLLNLTTQIQKIIGAKFSPQSLNLNKFKLIPAFEISDPN